MCMWGLLPYIHKVKWVLLKLLGKTLVCYAGTTGCSLGAALRGVILLNLCGLYCLQSICGAALTVTVNRLAFVRLTL